MEIHAIIRSDRGDADGPVLWVGLAAKETVDALVEHYRDWCGEVVLLSGRDLGWHLLGERPGRLSPTHPLIEKWKPGERVELCSGGYGGNPREYRPGVVERIDRTYGYHESLIVKFDDGEVRAINPDVMRHVRDENKEKTS